MNLIYNKFLSEMLAQRVVLTDNSGTDRFPADKFKVAIFRTSYVPSATETHTFDELKSAFEITPTGTGCTYVSGGAEVSFYLNSSDKSYKYFGCDNVKWYHMTVSDAGYLVIYKYADGQSTYASHNEGLMVACFSLNQHTLTDQSLNVTWRDTTVLAIEATEYYEKPQFNEITNITTTEVTVESKKGTKVDIATSDGGVTEFTIWDGTVEGSTDTQLDLNSTLPVQNKAIVRDGVNTKINAVTLDGVEVEIGEEEPTGTTSGVLLRTAHIVIPKMTQSEIEEIILG